MTMIINMVTTMITITVAIKTASATWNSQIIKLPIIGFSWRDLFGMRWVGQHERAVQPRALLCIEFHAE